MKHNKRFLLVAIAVLATLLLAVGVALAEITSETITTDFYYVNVGAMYYWSPVISPQPAEFTGFKFTADGTAVVELQEDYNKGGSLTAQFKLKGPGTAIITAKAVDKDGKELSVTGTLTRVFTLNKAKDITLTSKYAKTEVFVGDYEYIDDLATITINPVGTLHSYSNNDIVWSVSDTSLANINKWGKITGIKAGTVTVTATLKQDPAVTGKIDVAIVEADEAETITDLSFNSKSYDVKLADDSIDLWDYLTVTGPASYSTKYRWTTSDPTVATVIGGTVSFKKVGTATITVTEQRSGKTATCDINVKEVLRPATAASFSPATLTITGDTNLTSYLVKTPANSDSEFIWSVDDTSKGYATVTEKGKLITKKAGTVKVTATSKDNAQVTATITVDIKDPSPDKLTFSQTAFNIYEDDDSIDLYKFLIIEPNVPAYLVWKTSDNRIVEVSGGDLYPIKPGTATITVYDYWKPEVKAECTVTILETPVTGLAFTQAEFEIVNNGYGLDLGDYIEVTPNDSTKYSIYYTSSDPEIARVYDDTVYGQKVGTVTITASIRNSDTDIKTATCTVKVTERALTGLSFPKTEYTLNLMKKQEINLYDLLGYAPVDYPISCDDLTWTSSDNSIAWVDEEGTVYATEPGTVTITVTSEKYPTVSASTTVKIEKIAVSKVTLEANVKEDPNKNTLTLEPGLYINNAFTAVIEPVDAYYKEIYYKVADPDIATVSLYSGSINSYEYPYFSVYAGRKAGTTTVTVYVDDGTTVHEAALTLTVKKTASDLVLSEESLVLGLHKDKTQNIYWAPEVSTFEKDSSSSMAGVTWSSSDEKILKINKHTGKITVKKAGKVKITATAKDGTGATATCKVTVVKNLIKKITGQKVITLRVGDKYSNIYDYLKLTGTCKTRGVDFFNPVLKFKSSNDEVVSIDEDGCLAANKVGSSTITVQAQDGSKKKYSIKINVIAAVQ